MRRAFVIFLAAFVVFAVAGVGAQAVRGTDKEPFLEVEADGNYSVARAEDFSDFPIYSVGSSFEELPLVAVQRHEDKPDPAEPVTRDTVSFIYGSCEIPLSEDGEYDGGCAPPLAIEIWPACERYQGLYPFEPDESLTIRGSPAAFYEGHHRLELYTGTSTVVIFGKGREQLLKAADELEGVNTDVSEEEQLPAPAAGAREGGLECS